MLQDTVDSDENVPSGADWETCMTIAKHRLDDTAREFNTIFGEKNISSCIDDAVGNAGDCAKAVFGPAMVELAGWITDPLLADDGTCSGGTPCPPGTLQTWFNQIEDAVLSALPMPSDDDIKDMIVAAILNNDTIKALNEEFYALFSPIKDMIDEAATSITLLINRAIMELTVAINEALSEQLAAVSQMGEDIAENNPLSALSTAKLEGYALVGQDEIERLHLETELGLAPDPEKPINFYAALDVYAWGAENGRPGCSPPENSGGSYFDITISTRDVSAEMLGSDIGIKWALLGITIADNPPAGFPQISPCPVGVFGGIYTLGGFDVKAVKLVDLGLECGLGTVQNYLGATGHGSFDSFAVPMATFYLGKSCDSGVISRLDPQVGDFIDLDETQALAGIYVRAGVEFPVYTNGCTCDVGMGVDVGGWYFSEPEPETFGGLIGGSLFGRLGCVGSLKGKVLCMMQATTDGSPRYAGSAWAAAGIGTCNTADWRTIEDVRKDDPFCMTADATFGVQYIDSFEPEDPEVHCCD
jgi:hypothetical protein